MNCCAACFGHRGLSRNIFPFLETKKGDCSYCDSKGVDLFNPRDLLEHFELLVSSYKENDGGKLLVQWLREDWALFDHPHMDDSHSKDLLAEILDDGEIVRKKFVPAYDSQVDQLREWEKLRDELMHKNRFFPAINIDLERLETLLFYLVLDLDEIPITWWRARIQTGQKPYPIEEMSAPPNWSASHGRANPAGIPYLYLGSSAATAISEIRPHKGQIICVASFHVPGGLSIVDLRNPRKTVSPFALEDSVDIGRVRAELPFLQRLGEELTRPVLPEAAAIDYTPSQYLCEFIKKCGYSGLLYRSSVSDGINLALFDPQFAYPRNVAQYRVTQVSAEFEAIVL